MTKVLYLNVGPESIENAVREVALSKFCSALGIGPAVETRISFDLVVYDNAIQFHLERCLPFFMKRDQIWRFQSDLVDNLAALHYFQIIHKDIKPDNILWSNQYGRFVFCDFGISHYVGQQPGEPSETSYEGTYRFMSPEMQAIKKSKGFVDLYYNDAWSLTMTFQQVLPNEWPKQKEVKPKPAKKSCDWLDNQIEEYSNEEMQ